MKLRKFTAFLAIALFSLPLLAQSGYTVVSGSLSSICYNNGSIQASWINGNPTLPVLPTLNGTPFAQTVPTGIDSSGNFFLSLADTAIVVPNSPNLSWWKITACAKGGSQPACYTAAVVPVTGPTMNVNSYFSAATTACAVPSNGISQLHGDVVAGPGAGNQAATVQGIENTPFCSGFAPTNGQAIELTTASSPNPCYTAATPSATGITQLNGDATAGPGSGNQTLTFATVNSSPGTCGDATHVCQITTNGKGLVPSQTAIPIAAGSASGILQTQVSLPSNAQHVILYPTTASFQMGDPGTGSAVAGVTPNAASAFITNGPGGGSLSSNTWGVTFGGFSLPVYVLPANVTAIYPFAVSSNVHNNAFTYGYCNIGAGNAGLTPGGDHTTGTDWPLQQFTPTTTWVGTNIPSVNCTFQTQRTVTTSVTSDYQLDSTGLIVYYAGTAPPANTAVQVVFPLSYNAILNQLSDLSGTVTGTLTMAAGTSDTATVTGATVLSVCSLTPTNSISAASTTAAYISSVAINTVTVTHAATVANGGTMSVVCKAN